MLGGRRAAGTATACKAQGAALAGLGSRAAAPARLPSAPPHVLTCRELEKVEIYYAADGGEAGNVRIKGIYFYWVKYEWIGQMVPYYYSTCCEQRTRWLF